MKTLVIIPALLGLLAFAGCAAIDAPSTAAQSAIATKPVAVDVASYPSLQAAIDANPGRILRIPAADYTIDTALTITADGTELIGPARIIQTNPKQAMLRIENATGVRVSDLSFTRPEGRQEAKDSGVDISGCHDVELSRIKVTENHTHMSIRASNSTDVTVEDCEVINYKGPTIDDRTAPRHLSGYAFRSIDGTGIQFRSVQGGVIRNCRVEEFRLLPTKEVVAKYGLGVLTIVPKVPGRLMSKQIFDTHFTNNWHQGAAIQIANPEESSRVIVTGCYLFHPAQGLDVQADNVTVSNNIVAYAMIGMKAMHGSKHVLFTGNQFMYCDLWGIVLQPGSNSHPSSDTRGENVDGGTVISNNIFSQFGFGDQYWNWADHTAASSRNVIAVMEGQLAENPPIKDVLITGNLIYDTGRDTVLENGKWVEEPPRYHYALYIEQKRQPAPVNVHVYGNLFSPGLLGDTNFK